MDRFLYVFAAVILAFLSLQYNSCTLEENKGYLCAYTRMVQGLSCPKYPGRKARFTTLLYLCRKVCFFSVRCKMLRVEPSRWKGYLSSDM